MQWLLVIFGWTFVLLTLFSITIQFLRRRRDLINSWNLFLLGSANFVGIASIQTGMTQYHSYGTFSDSDYVKFVLGALVFYAVAALSYRFFRWPRTQGERRFRKWPPLTQRVIVVLLGACGILLLGFLFTPNVQFAGQLLHTFGLFAAILAVTFSFIGWFRQPANMALLAIFTIIFALSLVVVTMSAGRRNLLAVMLTIPICAYWLRWRYQSPVKMIVPLAVMLGAGIMFIGGFSAIRWLERNPDKSKWGAGIEVVRSIPGAFSRSGDALGLFGGDATEASLAAIHRFTGQAETKPFHTVVYVLTNPIPRAWWPDKPGALGELLPRDTGWWAMHGYVSWGVGIVGHGFYEGGYHMLAFYGILVGAFFRFFDSILETQPNNPFILATFSSVSGQIFALSRGEFGLFIVLILGGCATALILSWVTRLFFGTFVTPPPELALQHDPVHSDALHQYD